MSIALKFKRAVAAVSAGMMFSSLLVFGPATVSADTFADVSPTSQPWAYPFIEQGVEDGYFDAGVNFRPNDPIQRDEFSKILCFVIDCKAGQDLPATPTFKDVPKGWSYEAIEGLAALGIVGGTTDPVTKLPTGYFEPAKFITREEAAKMLVGAFQVPSTLTPDSSFKDMPVTDKAMWYYNWVLTAYNQSIFDGMKDAQGNLLGVFGLGQNITRAQAAKVIVTGQAYHLRGDGGDVCDPEVDANCEDGVCPDDMPSDPDCDAPLPPENFKGSLEVSLDNSLKGGTLPLNATNVVLAKFDFHATNGDVNVKSLEVSREGIGEEKDFANVYIFQDDVRVSSGKTFKQADNKAVFNNLQDLIIKSGETSKITVVAEVAGPGVAGSGDHHIISLAAKDDVTLNGEGSVSGDFALKGPDFEIGAQGTVVNTITAAKGSSLANVALGSTHAELGNARLEAGSDHDLELNQITFTQGGTVDSSDLANLTLELSSGDNKLLASAPTVENDRVTFILKDPLLIAEGKTINVSIFGDVVGGKTLDNIRFYIDENTDVEATDTHFLYGAKVVNNLTLALANIVKLEGGDITVTKTGPVSTQIANDSDDNVFTNFSINSVNEGVEVREMQVGVTIKDPNNNIPVFSSDTANIDLTPVAGGGCLDGDYELNLDANGDVNKYFVEGDMFKLGSFYGRVVSTDGTPINGGLCVHSSGDLTTLTIDGNTLTRPITEVNAYNYLEDLVVTSPSDDDVVLEGPLNKVSEGTLCTGDNVPAELPVCNAANTYATIFKDSFDLPVGKSDYSIKMDVAQELVAGYLVAAAVQFPDNSLKYTNSNEFVKASEIVGAGKVALTGNFMSIVEDDLVVTKAAIPTSQTFVKGSQNVSLLGATFQSGDAGDITLNDIKVRIYADGSVNPWTSATGDLDASDIVDTVALYDGNTVVAQPVSLNLVDVNNNGAFDADADYNVAEFNDVKLPIKAGISKTLTVKANLNGNDDSVGYLAADILPSADIEAEDKDGDNVDASGAALNGTTTKTPLITISAAGTLTITSKSNPDPGIILAGAQGQFMSQYSFSSLNDNQLVTRLSVANDLTGVFGDAEQKTDAITSVYLKYPNSQGVEVTSPTVSIGDNGIATFSNLTFYVKKNVPADLKIYANVATKVDGPGEAISGRIVRLGLLEVGNGEGTFKAQGEGSNQTTYTPVVQNGSNVPDQVVRVAKPVFTKLDVGPGLADGDQVLYKFSVKAEGTPGGSVRFGRLSFFVDQTGANMDLKTFKFLRGNTPISQANIYGVAAGELKNGAGLVDSADDTIVVSFDEEESIPVGQTVTYALQATVAQSDDNYSINTKLFTTEQENEVNDISASLVNCGGPNPVCSTGNGNTARIYDTGTDTAAAENNAFASTAAGFRTQANAAGTLEVGDAVRVVPAAGAPLYCTVTAVPADTSTGTVTTDCAAVNLADQSAISVFNEGLYGVTDDFAKAGGTARQIAWSDNSADLNAYPTVTDGTVTIGTGAYDFTNGARLFPNNISSSTLSK